MGSYRRENAAAALILALVFVILLAALPAGARVKSGTCSDCHTMHNSQGGLSMKLDSTQIGVGGGVCDDCHAALRPEILRLDCLGCHAQAPFGANNIIGNVPQIAHNAAADLAAGNYRYVFNDDCISLVTISYGHNVHGFFPNIYPDCVLGSNPPGLNTTYDPSTVKFDTTYNAQGQPRLMCAGSNGCHGDRDQISQTRAMYGTHHYNDSMLKFGTIVEGSQGTQPGSSYRFLYGVHGGEDANWEASVSSATHNEYKAANLPGAPGSFSQVVTISTLCAECHGNFHSAAGMGSASPWLRHPNDYTIPARAPYSSYTAYDPTVPVGRLSVPNSPSSTVTPGSDLIICLSCHRAHASPNAAMLRWDYRAWPAAGVTNGCIVCHSDKD